ncbi:MAG: hypothetical protein J2P54_01140, partial [Bradyrhizobiaceae bacterium]|nr:hypothetical protein [Bradyrhizobiaceae bacterium]
MIDSGQITIRFDCAAATSRLTGNLGLFILGAAGLSVVLGRAPATVPRCIRKHCVRSANAGFREHKLYVARRLVIAYQLGDN